MKDTIHRLVYFETWRNAVFRLALLASLIIAALAIDADWWARLLALYMAVTIWKLEQDSLDWRKYQDQQESEDSEYDDPERDYDDDH